MYYDIVILPPEKTRKQIGDTIKKVSHGHPTTFVVDNKKLIPHLSLFHIRTSKKGLAKVAKTVKEVLPKYHSEIIQSQGLYVVGESLCLQLSKSKSNNKLHRELIRKCNEFRTGEMPWTNHLRKPTKIQTLYRKRYGTQHILRFFNPHITLANFTKQSDITLAQKMLKNLNCKFKGDTIAICEVNYWHQVTRIVETFQLN